jgi:hypothetical protein
MQRPKIKDATVILRLSDLDKRLLKERAESEQLCMSSYIRHKLLKKDAK